MVDPSSDLLTRATFYATTRGCALEHGLGYGKDGSVFSTTVGSAIKVFHRRGPYEAERDCYQRLAEMEVVGVLGHRVPQLKDFNDSLLSIEMTLVQPPYILDFAGARLDFPPEFPAEVLEQWEQDRAEEFGPRWPRVRLIIDLMADRYGIYLTDIHPRNIAFRDDR
jgi:hypothetical protein